MLRHRASTLLSSSGVPALLITNLVNIRYLTGVDLSAGALLVKKNAYLLYVDPRYAEAAKRATVPGLSLRDYAQLARDLKQYQRCGFEAEHLTVVRLSRLKALSRRTKFIQTTNIVERLRRQKQPDELAKFRRAQYMTRSVMELVPSLLTPGISERELAWKLEVLVREKGADGMSFAPIVAFGTHTSRPHHHPTDRTLRSGHLVQIDMGVRYRGYCADQSRVFFTAPPTNMQKRVYDAILQAKTATQKAVKPGASTHELDRLARQVLASHELEQYFTHSLGHGVGLEIHEGVSLSQKATQETLLHHEIITIEPGVYIPGRFGMRLEDEIIVR